MGNNTLIILTPGFPADEADSSCLPFPQSFVKNLQQLNPTLHIVVLAFQYPFFTGNYQWHGVEVHAFNGRSRGKVWRLLTWMAVRKKLKTIAATHSIGGILSLWLGECALVARHASQKYKVPSFTWLLGQDARKHNRYFSLVQPAANKLVALSDAVAAELYRNYHIRPVHIIPPGIDATLFQQATHERTIDIMAAGSLIPLKQYEHFIQVIANLVVRRPHLKAILCGDGPDKQRLQQLIHTHKLQHNITLYGKLAHANVLTLMQQSKVFLHPSSYEGFSTVCAEALYAGAHVVSYCQPMERSFDHLHIVETAAAMEQVTEQLLNNAGLDHSPVLTYAMADCCSQVLALYN